MVTNQGISLSREALGAATAKSFARMNFPEGDRGVENRLHPHLMQAEENNHAFSQNQHTLTQFKQILDRMGAIIVVIDEQVQFMTQRAEKLLSQYFLARGPHSLPEPLHHWFKHQIAQLTFNENVSSCLPLQMEQAGRQLSVRLIPHPIREQYLILVEERELPSFSISALELLGLTKREAEVLFWIAKDKSNASIARVLGCTEGTVRKHLEHLYAKLGVQTRTGAVMVALEKLGLIKG
ncbi:MULTISPECIES: response regulator transcription factor [Planktothricoides]|uniref:Helix-turn-helix transcriptional regulator n=1 Tax=Planktothricoides raciborskii GIHE-MW2 TaxID=2792601 RepID=A0AAU8JFB4_9CYAN|nr:helix-turn-helix transcriptional regulator [Planktothricoides sp. SR001]